MPWEFNNGVQWEIMSVQLSPDPKPETPKLDGWVPKVGETVRVIEVSSFHVEGEVGFSTNILKVGDIGEIRNVGVISTGPPYVPETVGFQVFSIGKKTAWCKVEPYWCELDLASEKKSNAKPCHWCGEDRGPLVLHKQECNSCHITEEVAEVAEFLYQERLKAGGLNDCLAERATVARIAKKTVADYRRPSCICCGSKEGMPDGYGSGSHVFGLARAEEQRLGDGSRKNSGAVCITCVQKGFAYLDRIVNSTQGRDPDPEPSAAPHWPAQHSTPSWED